MELPALDRVDAGTLALVLLLLFVAYVVYPTQIVQLSVWTTIIMVFVCWTGYFLYKLAFDEMEF